MVAKILQFFVFVKMAKGRHLEFESTHNEYLVVFIIVQYLV